MNSMAIKRAAAHRRARHLGMREVLAQLRRENPDISADEPHAPRAAKVGVIGRSNLQDATGETPCTHAQSSNVGGGCGMGIRPAIRARRFIARLERVEAGYARGQRCPTDAAGCTEGLALGLGRQRAWNDPAKPAGSMGAIRLRPSSSAARSVSGRGDCS
jgi:hypothetical protein